MSPAPHRSHAVFHPAPLLFSAQSSQLLAPNGHVCWALIHQDAKCSSRGLCYTTAQVSARNIELQCPRPPMLQESMARIMGHLPGEHHGWEILVQTSNACKGVSPSKKPQGRLCAAILTEIKAVLEKFALQYLPPCTEERGTRQAGPQTMYRDKRQWHLTLPKKYRCLLLVRHLQNTFSLQMKRW